MKVDFIFGVLEFYPFLWNDCVLNASVLDLQLGTKRHKKTITVVLTLLCVLFLGESKDSAFIYFAFLFFAFFFEICFFFFRWSQFFFKLIKANWEDLWEPLEESEIHSLLYGSSFKWKFVFFFFIAIAFFTYSSLIFLHVDFILSFPFRSAKLLSSSVLFKFLNHKSKFMNHSSTAQRLTRSVFLSYMQILN